MYLDFFNLKEKPFNLTPSPRFIYLSESHKEALALLTYGVVERKGFILLTGEVGTGKTTMVQVLIEGLKDNVTYIHLSNPLLSPSEFIDYLSYSLFKTRIHFKSKTEFLFEFEEYLREGLKRNTNFVLIIDEAQKLSFELLEEIRLLSNMETADEKLINIFLVGQPELNEKLAESRSRALLQRISVRHHIQPLDVSETEAYIETRLRIAGASNGAKIFTKGAIKALHEFSLGYPRVINILADNAMLSGYAKEKRKITYSIIRECHEERNIYKPQPKRGRESRELLVSGKSRKRGLRKSLLPSLVVIFLVLIGGGLGLKQMGHDVMGWFRSYVSMIPLPLDKPVPRTQSSRENVEEERAPLEVLPEEPGLIPGGIIREENAFQNSGSPVTGGGRSWEVPAGENEVMGQSVIVKQGDTLVELAIQVYGFANEIVLNRVKESNPELTDVNRIAVGQSIFFPFLDTRPEQAPAYTVHIASFKPFENARELFRKLLEEGFEVFLLPAYHASQGKIFRITIGNFETRQESDLYASEILRRGVSEYAETIQLEMR